MTDSQIDAAFLDLHTSDPVVAARDQLVDLVRGVSIIAADNVLSYYTQRDLETGTRRIEPPAVGVVYAGMVGKDSAGTGIMGDVSFDVILVGGDQCRANINGAPADALGVLSLIRAHVLDRCAKMPQGQRPFRFAFETLADISKHVAYRQRWTTTVGNVRHPR